MARKAAPKDKMKQVAVRMTKLQHAAAVKAAKKNGISFGEFVRRAVKDRVDYVAQGGM